MYHLNSYPANVENMVTS